MLMLTTAIPDNGL